MRHGNPPKSSDENPADTQKKSLAKKKTIGQDKSRIHYQKEKVLVNVFLENIHKVFTSPCLIFADCGYIKMIPD
jgi:hypothetical protein